MSAATVRVRAEVIHSTPQERHKKYMALVDYETALRADAAYSEPVRAKLLREQAEVVRTQIHSFVGEWREPELAAQLRAKW